MARIVIVDDSLAIRAQLRAILEEAGHEIVGEAADGEHAPELVASVRPDLVTLDMVMPGRDGIATLRHLHLRQPGLRVVVCSASATERRVLEALRLGASDFVTKPFDPAKLLAAIDAALAS